MRGNPFSMLGNLRGGGAGQTGAYNPANTGNSFLDQYSPDYRKQFYGQLTPGQLSSLQGVSGWDQGAFLQDYNALMGANFTPLDAAQYAGGFSNQDVYNWLSSATPNQIEQTSLQWGLTPTDLATGWNRVSDENVTPWEASQYTGLPMQGGGFGFDIPTNLFPTTTSHHGQSSKSFSGIDWKRPLAGSLLGDIQEWAKKLPGLAEQLPAQLEDYYDSLMGSQLGPDAFQGTLNSLASRGMIGSQVAGEALNNARRDIIRDTKEKAWAGLLEGLKAQMNVPGLLGSLAQLDQVSTSQSQGGGGSTSTNPLAPYEAMIPILLGL